MAHHQRSKSTSKLPNGIEIGIHENCIDASLYDRNSRLICSLEGSDLKQNGAKLLTDQSQDKIVNDNNVQTPNGTQHYVDEWQRLFKDANYISKLKSEGIEGTLRSSRFRSVCWRIYLECLSEDQDSWIAETTKARERYNQLKKRFLTNPRLDDFAADLALNNPLSQEETSPWNRYFQDSELKVTIRQDVIRTFPEIEFFHSIEIRDMMVNILFCYAREYPQMQYKQGMHELLAPIIFVLHSDHQAFLHAIEIELVDYFIHYDRDVVKVLLDPAFIEHDAFYMFSQIMEVVEPWYLVREIYPKIDRMNVCPFARPQDLHPTNVIIFKLTRIHDQLLKRHDPELFHHLEKLEIAPQIFGIRWLRLLFGREFPLQDLLVIWDVIFADSMAFDLVDYIFISMLMFIRELLLSSEYATCLSHLMRYPAVTDVQYIIDVALHLRDPQHYNKPSGYSVQMLHHVPTVGGRADIHRAPIRNNSNENVKEQIKTWGPQKPPNKVVSGISSLTKKMASRPRSLALSQDLIKADKVAMKASSEPATFESRSPSPTLTEYVKDHPETIRPDVRRSSLSQSETELQPIGTKGTDRSYTKIKHDDDQSAEESSPLPEKTLARKGSLSFKWSKDIKNKGEMNSAAYHLGQLNELQAMCKCCSQKMTVQIDRLQECIFRQNLENEDEMLIALAGLKQVRDILKGTLKFTQNLLDADDIVISDNHYPEEPKSYCGAQSSTATIESNATELNEIQSSISQKYQSFQEVSLDDGEPAVP